MSAERLPEDGETAGRGQTAEILSDPSALATRLLEARDPFTLGLPDHLDRATVKSALAGLDSEPGWQAYDLVHGLEVFGRAW